MPGGRGRGGAGRGVGDDLAVQVGGLSVWQGDQAGDAWAGGLGAASLTWVRGARVLPGDKMIDWVFPPGGDAAAQSNRAEIGRAHV